MSKTTTPHRYGIVIKEATMPFKVLHEMRTRYLTLDEAVESLHFTADYILDDVVYETANVLTCRRPEKFSLTKSDRIMFVADLLTD
jgi:hypothetical protein